MRDLKAKLIEFQAVFAAVSRDLDLLSQEQQRALKDLMARLDEGGIAQIRSTLSALE